MFKTWILHFRRFSCRSVAYDSFYRLIVKKETTLVKKAQVCQGAAGYLARVTPRYCKKRPKSDPPTAVALVMHTLLTEKKNTKILPGIQYWCEERRMQLLTVRCWSSTILSVGALICLTPNAAFGHERQKQNATRQTVKFLTYVSNKRNRKTHRGTFLRRGASPVIIHLSPKGTESVHGKGVRSGSFLRS